MSGAPAPPSAAFIDFVAHWLDGQGYGEQEWSDQLAETLSHSSRTMQVAAECRLERIITDALGVAAFERVHDWFHRLASEGAAALGPLHRRFEFLVIVGAPRSGGTYLTAEAFNALGYDPQEVPAAIAHDGFPDVAPRALWKHGNGWIDSLMRASEYLVMLELYFENPLRTTPTLIPKKIAKGICGGGLFKTILGPRTRYLLTIRHPIGCCISTYEKSGGLSADGGFQVRSAIERWIWRDLVLTGVPASELRQMDYFCAFVRYWEQFYIGLALSGLVANCECRVVPYGAESMQGIAQSLHEQCGSRRTPTRFVASARLDGRHPEWVERSRQALERVASVWQLVGLRFPHAELLECA